MESLEQSQDNNNNTNILSQQDQVSDVSDPYTTQTNQNINKQEVQDVQEQFNKIDLDKSSNQQQNNHQQDGTQQLEQKDSNLTSLQANAIDLQEIENLGSNNDEDISEFKDAVCEINFDIEEARKLKEKANQDFKYERFDECIRLYDQAIRICPPEEVKDLAIFYNNKGICYQKLKNDKEAKVQFSKAIEINPEYIKPRSYRMNILKSEEDFESAYEDAKKIEELDPSYPSIHREVKELDVKRKEKFEKMKQEVLGNLKSFGNTILGKFGMSLDNFKLNQNPDGTYNINYQNQ